MLHQRTCPGCGKVLSLRTEDLGGAAVCGACGRRFEAARGMDLVGGGAEPAVQGRGAGQAHSNIVERKDAAVAPTAPAAHTGPTAHIQRQLACNAGRVSNGGGTPAGRDPGRRPARSNVGGAEVARRRRSFAAWRCYRLLASHAFALAHRRRGASSACNWADRRLAGRAILAWRRGERRNRVRGGREAERRLARVEVRGGGAGDPGEAGGVRHERYRRLGGAGGGAGDPGPAAVGRHGGARWTRTGSTRSW